MQACSMSRDPDSYYEEEYFEEIGKQELIAQTLEDISQEGIRTYLGENGDAVDARLNEVLAQANYARQQGYPRYALVGAVTAIELTIRYLLVRPLVHGAFLSDNWAKLLTRHIAFGKTGQERDILPAMLENYAIDIKEMKLSNRHKLWKTIIETVIPKRNGVVHDGENATAEEAIIALECANTLREHVVRPIAVKMGFTLDVTGCWHKIADRQRDSYEPTSPFGA
jgi:hypothetical protein